MTPEEFAQQLRVIQTASSREANGVQEFVRIKQERVLRLAHSLSEEDIRAILHAPTPTGFGRGTMRMVGETLQRELEGRLMRGSPEPEEPEPRPFWDRLDALG